MEPDALIIADPGMFTIAKEVCPEIDIHISTQANNTNYRTFDFGRIRARKRVVAARELSLAELKEIRKRYPPFQGLRWSALYTEPCAYPIPADASFPTILAGRDANRGECTHPCRWKYVLEEETRPGEYFPVFENERGTYIMNSRDLCMIEHIPELIEAGIDSFKIEGRMKTALYVACVARTYRRAIDDYMESPKNTGAALNGTRKRSASAPPGPSPPDSILVSPETMSRYMTAVPM